jgi:hypothetical protein
MERLTSFSGSRLFAVLSLLCQALLLSQGCASGPASPTRQSAVPHATVYYDEVADWSFEAAHPAVINEAAIKQALSGFHIGEGSVSNTSSADGSKPMRVFSDEDVEHLAPLLARALSQAQPEYVVAFRLSSSAGSGSEPTAGTIYVKDQEIHVTLTAYQGTDSPLGQTPSALTVSFTPESAAHRRKADPTVALGRRDLVTWAIDYNLLVKQSDQVHADSAAPVKSKPEPKDRGPILMADVVTDNGVAADTASAADPEAVGRTEQKLKDAQRTITRRDAKIDRLRRDLESMRQQLEAKDKELREVKSKPAPINRQKRGKAELVIR